MHMVFWRVTYPKRESSYLEKYKSCYTKQRERSNGQQHERWNMKIRSCIDTTWKAPGNQTSGSRIQVHSLAPEEEDLLASTSLHCISSDQVARSTKGGLTDHPSIPVVFSMVPCQRLPGYIQVGSHICGSGIHNFNYPQIQGLSCTHSCTTTPQANWCFLL